MNQNPRALPGNENDVFLVGDLRVEVGRQRVTREDGKVVLPNLSFRLRLALIRAAPNILSNELPMEHAGSGLIVSPETVSKRVTLLRDALGDDAREPRYIAAVRGRGYRRSQDPPDSAIEGAELPARFPTTTIESASVLAGRVGLAREAAEQRRDPGDGGYHHDVHEFCRQARLQ